MVECTPGGLSLPFNTTRQARTLTICKINITFNMEHINSATTQQLEQGLRRACVSAWQLSASRRVSRASLRARRPASATVTPSPPLPPLLGFRPPGVARTSSAAAYPGVSPVPEPCCCRRPLLGASGLTVTGG